MYTSLQFMAVLAATFCIYRYVFGRRTGDGQVGSRKSLSGWLAGSLIANLIGSLVLGTLGLAFIKAVVTLILIVPLILLGVKVELPDEMTAWPRSIAYRLQHIFRDKAADVAEAVKDKREAVVEKIGDVRDAVVDRVRGKKVDYASDEFWGGPKDKGASEAIIRDERTAFDALPPEQKVAMLDDAVGRGPKNHASDQFGDLPGYEMRTGKSTSMIFSKRSADRWRLSWEIDASGDFSSDPVERAHMTNFCAPSKQCDYEQCRIAFGRLNPREKLAAALAAIEFKRPLPDSVSLPADKPRDAQYYQLWVCPTWAAIVQEDELNLLKDGALAEVRSIESRQAKDKHDHLKNLAEAAKDKAGDVASNLREKAADQIGDMKEKAADAVKDGVRDAATGSIRSFFGR